MTKKHRLDIWFVIAKIFEAPSWITCRCCQLATRHATAPTHYIGRHYKRLALFLIVRGKLSVSSTPNCLSYTLYTCVSPQFRSLCTSGEEQPTLLRTYAYRTANCGEWQTVARSAQEGRLSSTLWIELKKACSLGCLCGHNFSRTPHRQNQNVRAVNGAS